MASGFKVYRDGVLINANATSPFVDTGLTNGQQYSYQVSAFNDVGDGPKAGPLTATPFAQLISVYGTGMAGESRNNKRLDGTPLSFRFKCTQNSTPSYIKVSERGKGGDNSYSEGTGGTPRCRIMNDNGSGKPGSTVYGTISWSPGNPVGNWEVWTQHNFTGTSPMTAGQIYHLVFDNIHASFTTNRISLNALFAWNNPPNYLFGPDFATLYGSGYPLSGGDIPIFDLAYTNGQHDGQGYIGELGGSSGTGAPYYGTASGTLKHTRQTMTVSGGNKTITSAFVRVKRISGSSPLIITLETSGGSVIDTVSVPSSSIALGQYPTGADDQAHLSGNTWAGGNFAAPHVLTNGQTYYLRFSTAAGTEYIFDPIQEGTSKGLLSFAFTDGQAEKTTNGGSSWAPLYPFLDTALVDLQFYLNVV